MTEMLNKEFSRKSFVKGGGAMIVGFSLGGAMVTGKAQAQTVPWGSGRPIDRNQIDTYITIHADNTASVRSGRVELGQGSTTGLLLIAAEELDMDFSQLKHAAPDTTLTPDTGSTGASSSISVAGPYVRAAAAAARQALLDLASAGLGVPVAALTVSSGLVSGGGRSVKYGDLLGGKLFNVTMPASFGLTPERIAQAGSGFLPGAARPVAGLLAGAPGAKPVSQYKVVGTEVPRIDIPDKVTGQYVYVHQVKVPGMLHARVVRPRGQGAYPSGAPVVSVDETSIKHTGARVVRRGDFLAVVAETEYSAIQAAAQLKVEWADPPRMASSGNMWKQMREFDKAGLTPARPLAGSASGGTLPQMNRGNVDAARASAPFKAAATYMHHYTGHQPIGPSCAVADVRPNGAVIFSSTQSVYSTRSLIAGITALPPESVRVIYYEGASNFGSAPYNDAALAAAVVSQLIGKPVRLQFMRWDEHGWDNHSNPLLVDIQGAVDANGKIVAYDYTAFGQPGTGLSDLTRQLTGASIPPPGLGQARLGNAGGAAHSPYVVPNLRLTGKSLPLFNNYLKLGALRGVQDVQENFATEQFIDELAYSAKMDPVEFRRRNLSAFDGGRWSSVLEAVAKLSAWRPKVAASQLQSGDIVRGRGIAIGTINNVITMAAVVADVEVNTRTGKILVKDIWAAENVGLTVSPAGVHNQMIGCLVTGASRALCEQMTFDTKRVTSLDWVTYPSLRFRDSPRAHVMTVEQRDVQPTGSGEPSLIPVGAAIANAFFDATGVRVREAPMTPARVRATLKAAGVA
jgi:CO/xanthine dehydrogenase Mo-binding subunit